MNRFFYRGLVLLSALLPGAALAETRPLVLFSDFGTTERFVASMKGVAMSVDRPCKYSTSPTT